MFCFEYKSKTEEQIRSFMSGYETVNVLRQMYLFNRRHNGSFLRSNGLIFGRILDDKGVLQPIDMNRGDQGVESIFRYISHYEIFNQFFYSSSYWISKILPNKDNQPVTQNSKTRVMARLGSLNNFRPGSIVLDEK
jgi:hypothetical protein